MVTEYLDDNGGGRVYRDGIRVYNYGEVGEDWLGLDIRRVNAPTRKISQNIILGAIHLSLKSSTGLIEKTNREGFVENDAVTPIGRPEAARVTLPLNPPAPVTVIGDSKYRRHCGDQNPSKRGPAPTQVWSA